MRSLSEWVKTTAMLVMNVTKVLACSKSSQRKHSNESFVPASPANLFLPLTGHWAILGIGIRLLRWREDRR